MQNHKCPERHLKKCKYMETCRFQERCQYRHNTSQEMNVHSKIIEATKEVEDLKAEIYVLKKENDKEVNFLMRVHHR